MPITQSIVNGSQTALSVGEGNFLAQSGAVARHTFHRSLVLAEGESADAWREVTAAQKAQIEAEDEGRMAPPQVFIDYWNAVWTVRCTFNHLNDPLIDRVLGKYDPENAPDAQHPFRAYDDVWLTYEEAMQVIKEYHWAPGQNTLAGCLQNAHSRVAVPFTFGAHSKEINLASIAVYNDDIEEVCFAFGPYTWGFQIYKLDTAFHATRSKLRKIHGILPVRANCTFSGWVSGATNLESFRLWGLAKDIEMASCPKLDLATVDYLITNRAGTNGITVTLHPTVYDKIMDEANEEWHALLDKAASKNITIATTN